MTSVKPNKTSLNRFLQTRNEINQCTEILRQHNLIEHGLDCKNFDIRMIVPYLEGNNILDMGASGSFILHNAIRLNTTGKKVGIDLTPVPAHDRAEGAEYFEGDLMKTPFPDEEFQTITCLSVIEHQVDYSLFAKECSRLLKNSGELFISFDYFDPKPDTSAMKLYSLDWNILDKKDVLRLIDALKKNGLNIVGDINWDTNEAVINPKYCSPANVSYTFGLFHFVKGEYRGEIGSSREEGQPLSAQSHPVEEVVEPSLVKNVAPKTGRRISKGRERREARFGR